MIFPGHKGRVKDDIMGPERQAGSIQQKDRKRRTSKEMMVIRKGGY